MLHPSNLVSPVERTLMLECPLHAGIMNNADSGVRDLPVMKPDTTRYIMAAQAVQRAPAGELQHAGAGEQPAQLWGTPERDAEPGGWPALVVLG